MTRIVIGVLIFIGALTVFAFFGILFAHWQAWAERKDRAQRIHIRNRLRSIPPARPTVTYWPEPPRGRDYP